MTEADVIEAHVADALSHRALFGASLEVALAEVDHAIALREHSTGPEDVSLIWPLSLKIELLGIGHREELTAQRAALGERRLRLRRVALAAMPSEIAHSLRELAGLYRFEDVCIDTARCAALVAEAGALDRSAR